MSPILEILSPIVVSADVEMLSSTIGEILSLIWEILAPLFGRHLEENSTYYVTSSEIKASFLVQSLFRAHLFLYILYAFFLNGEKVYFHSCWHSIVV